MEKENSQLQQQLMRAQQQQQQITSTHVNQPINPMFQNQMTYDSELMKQINNSSNQSLSSISSFPMVMNQNLRLTQPINNINNQRIRTVQDGIHPSIFNKRNIELTMRPNISQQLLYFQQQQVLAHITAEVGHPQHLQRKNDSQPQPPGGNASTPQQSIIDTNGVQTQSQQPNQATSTTSVMNKLPDGSLNMNLEEVKNYYSFDQSDMDCTEFGSVTDFDINDFVTFDSPYEELGYSNDAGPSTSTKQPLGGNTPNVAATLQQSIMGTNGVQIQSQQPNQATSTTSVMNELQYGSLNMNLEEVKNYYSFDQLDMDGTEFDMNGGPVTDFDINDFITFDNLADKLGYSNNAGLSTSTIQPPSENASNVTISQQSIIDTNGVQTQPQQPDRATSTTSVMNELQDIFLNMNLEDGN